MKFPTISILKPLTFPKMFKTRWGRKNCNTSSAQSLPQELKDGVEALDVSYDTPDKHFDKPDKEIVSSPVPFVMPVPPVNCG